MPKTPTAGVSFQPAILEQIAERGNRSTVINRDLDRLYTLYSRVLREVALSVDEACLIVDALNGRLMDANTVRMLWAAVEDAIRLDGLAEKWGVDGDALVEKLKGLNDIQALAVIDAAERFWVAVPNEGEMKEMVRKVFEIKG